MGLVVLIVIVVVVVVVAVPVSSGVSLRADVQTVWGSTHIKHNTMQYGVAS